MKRDDVLRKIRACLARADADRNSNEAERATALRQANAMMDEYGVQAVDLEGDELGPMGQEGLGDSTHVTWRATVLNHLVQLYGCQCYRSSSTKQSYVVGRAHYRSVVIDMTKYVLASIERESRGLRSDRTYRTSWRLGAAAGIRETVKSILEHRRSTRDGPVESRAMVLVNHYALQRQDSRNWMDENLRLNWRTRATRASDHSAYTRGHAFGAGINLSDQLGANPSSVRQLR